MTDRIQRAQERLRIAARLYHLGCEERGDGLAKTSMQLCDGARFIAQDEGDRDLARWADGCGEVAYDAWMGGTP